MNRLVITAAGILLSVALARLLGPTKLGIVIIIMLIPEYYEKFCRFGLETGAIYRISRNEISIEEAAGTLLTISIAVGSLPFLTFFFYKELFYKIFLKSVEVPTWYFLAILSTLPAIFIAHYFNSFFTCREDVRTMNRLSLMTGLLPGMISVLLLVSTRLDIGAVILGTASANLISVLYVLNRYKALAGRLPLFSRSTKNTSLLFRYGFKVYLRQIINFVHYRIDLLMIMLYLTPPFVAFYRLAVNIAEKVLLKIDASTYLLIPRVAGSQDDYGVELTSRIFRNIFWILTALAVFIFFTSEPLIGFFYGEEFLPVVSPLKLLLPGIVMLGTCISINRYYIGIGSVGITNYVYGSSVCVNIFLNILLIPQYGIEGAAVATTMTYTISSFVMIGLFLKNTGIGPMRLFIITREDILSYRKLLSDVYRNISCQLQPIK